MKPEFTTKELIDLKEYMSHSPFFGILTMNLGMNYLTNQLNNLISKWENKLSNSNNKNDQLASIFLLHYKEIRETLFCDINELPLKINDNIARWRLEIGK